MWWDRFFEDLEDQLDSAWEAERAALDTEADRLRFSHVTLRERIVALAAHGRAVTIELSDGTPLAGRVTRVGADWIGAADDGRSPVVLVPLWAIAAVTATAEAVLTSVRGADAGPALAQRMGFGFVLRDLVRRRIGVSAQLTAGRSLHGTIDRAGADHLDIALHEPGSPRRAENVTGLRIVPFTAIVAVRIDAPTALV